MLLFFLDSREIKKILFSCTVGAVDGWKVFALKRLHDLATTTSLGDHELHVLVTELHATTSLQAPLVTLLTAFTDPMDLVMMARATYRLKMAEAKRALDALAA